MNTDDIILKLLNSEKEYDSEVYKEKNEFFHNNLMNKSNENINEFLNETVEKLIETPVNERGGLIAITGFYYQMLVAIDYLIEMKQGNWDYIAVELHDDIIAVKDNNIRFIQVKTSNQVSCIVSEKPASDLYSRSKKTIKINGKDTETKISNSWIDKLILKSRYFKNEDGFSTEFELLTNYVILDSSNIKIEDYIDRNLKKKIKSNNDIYKRLIKPSYIIDNTSQIYKEIDYTNLCGESLESLLTRFYIKSKQNSLKNIHIYLNDICYRIAIEIGGVYIDSKDINWIIGELLAKCNVNADVMNLVIKKEHVESLFLELKSRAINKAEVLVDENSTKKIVESVYESIHNDYREMPSYSIIERKILEYKEYLINWINSNGGIEKIINRYMSANEIGNSHINMNKRDKENLIEDLIIMPVILKIIHNKEILYNTDKYLLTKVIENTNNTEISLLRIKGKVELKKIKLVLDDLGIDNMLKIVTSKNLTIILQGYTDRKFMSTRREELKYIDKHDSLMDIEDSIKNVYPVLSLIPGEYIKEDLKESLEDANWNGDQLIELWKNIMEGNSNAC